MMTRGLYTTLAVVTTLLADSSHAFVTPSKRSFAAVRSVTTTSSSVKFMLQDETDMEKGTFDPFNLSDGNNDLLRTSGMAGTTAAFWLALPAIASAAGPDWGIFEGRTGSLLHPITMGSMFLFSLYTAFLGFQWRRQRTLGDEISDLKKTLPSFEGKSLSEALANAEAAEEVDTAYVNKLKAALPTEKQIDELVKERKELSSQGNRDKHFNQGALLAFVGTAFAIEGPLNTYARAGKLFPGPHLYAGAGLVVLWAAAAACVPYMQKGNETARSLHIAANVSGLGLFGWQVVSGWPILLKVIEKTKWP